MLDERGTGIPDGKENQIMLLNCLDLQSEVGLAVWWTWSGWNTSVSDSGWHCQEKSVSASQMGCSKKNSGQKSTEDLNSTSKRREYGQISNSESL